MRTKKLKSKTKTKSNVKADTKTTSAEVKDYRYQEKRKNVPESGLVTYVKEKNVRKHYEFDPHLEPQLQWAGKKEHLSFDADTVALHIHERVSTQAILKAVQKKQWLQTTLNLFAEPELPLDKRIEFYQHEVNWSNRLILGDSLLVMNSLLEQELMSEKVQMIYVDPPYGIAYNSNFQPFINQREVNDKLDLDLTREPEQIKAYRDTWELGIHSYLTYLRDRLLLCKELLTESGSIFVQISDENLHHVQELLDEIFGPQNFMSLITFRKKNMPLGAKFLESISDYIIWYAKDKEKVKFHQLFTEMSVEGDAHWNMVELADSTRRKMSPDEINNHKLLPKGSIVYR